MNVLKLFVFSVDFYDFMDKSDWYFTEGPWVTFKFWFMVSCFLIILFRAIIHIVYYCIKSEECKKGKHSWNARGVLGCHCKICRITMKEYVERGGIQ